MTRTVSDKRCAARCCLSHCENALGMGGLMAINAECWLDILNAMPVAEIAEYVRAKYKPGLLNPFKCTSLFIKS